MKTRTTIEQRLKESTDPRDRELLTWVLEDDNTLTDFVRKAVEAYPMDQFRQVKHLRTALEGFSKERLGLKECVDLIRNFKGGN